MSPLRWDVLAIAFVLAIPLLALGLRGDLEWPDVMSRLPWCLLAAWGAVALLRWASQPRAATPGAAPPAKDDAAAKEPTPAP
jgi:hypothetical protein